jgi:hypothetical protein
LREDGGACGSKLLGRSLLVQGQGATVECIEVRHEGKLLWRGMRAPRHIEEALERHADPLPA